MQWKLEKRKIKDLKALSKNPRRLTKNDAEQLEKSLTKFGQCEPVVVNSDNKIIGGHQRIRTLKKMGYNEVDAYVPDTPLSDEEVDELCIRLNRNSGSFDFDALANNFDIDDLLEWGFELQELGFAEDVEEIEENEKPEREKKLTTCPSCGHEF